MSNAVMQTKVINCNIANKSCLLQLVHTKAIAASMQFCDFSINAQLKSELWKKTKCLNEKIDSWTESCDLGIVMVLNWDR